MKTRRILIPVFGFVAAAVLAVAGGWFALGNVANAQTDLAAPTNVRAAQGTAIGQAVVSWDAVAGATGYTVQWVDLDAAHAAYDANGRWSHLIETRDIPASGDARPRENIYGLKPNTSKGYAFRVRSQRDGAVSGWSQWKILRLTAEVDFEAAAEILAAALEIIRQSSALVSADLPTNEDERLQYGDMVDDRDEALQDQLAVLNGSGHADRAAKIERLVKRLVSNSRMIHQGRETLLKVLNAEFARNQLLRQTNTRQLFPNAAESVDEQFYSLVSDGAGGPGNAATPDVLRYSHLSRLTSDLLLGHSLLQVASVLSAPTNVARIQEGYDSVANRIDQDILYLQALRDPELQRDVLTLARDTHDAGSGPNNYFDHLERRLSLGAAEKRRIADSTHTLALLRDEVARLAADVTGRQQPTALAPSPSVDENPGVTANEVRFGQSAVLTGPTASLGTQMEIGIRAAFDEINEAGGVHGRTLNLLPTLDDRYEPDAAVRNTRKLIEEYQVFGLIGAVGTPTSRAAFPLAQAAGVPFIGPFTGAQLLRDDKLTNVLNLRASYHQETERMVEYLEGQDVTRVAVLYQNDSYGVDGLTGVEQELKERGMEVAESWYYPRNTSAVRSAVYQIAAADPQAVIIIGASAPAAEAIPMLREKLGDDMIFMNVSFVGSSALATALGAAGEGVFVTQVVPLPTDDTDPLVAKYQAALDEYYPDEDPGFISLEGYMVGRLAIEGLQRCGQELTRTCFLNAVQNAGTFDLDGFELMFGANDNQGSDEVILTQIDDNEQYSVVE